MMDLFREMWLELRDYYAPTTSAPAATKALIKAMQARGHEAASAGKTWMIVDGEVFSIKKTKGHVHFQLTQHGICC